MPTPKMLDELPDTTRFELAWRIRRLGRVHGVLRADGRDLLHVDMRRLDLRLDLQFNDPATSAARGHCRWDRQHGAWGRAAVTTTGEHHVVHVVKHRPSWLHEPWHFETPTGEHLARLEEPTGRSLLRRYLRIPSRWRVMDQDREVAKLVDARSLTAFAATIEIMDPDLDPRHVERLLLGIVVRHARHLT